MAMHWIRETGILAQQLHRILSRLLQQFHLVCDVRELELRKSVLSRPEELAGAAQLEIQLGDSKAIGGFGHRAHACLCRFARGFRKQDAVARLATAADPAAELVQLREAK